MKAKVLLFSNQSGEINNFLNKDGYLILEIGYDQKEEVQKMLENSECIKDYAGNDRVIIWKR